MQQIRDSFSKKTYSLLIMPHFKPSSPEEVLINSISISCLLLFQEKMAREEVMINKKGFLNQESLYFNQS